MIVEIVISAYLSYACMSDLGAGCVTKQIEAQVEWSAEDIAWMEKCVEAEETDMGYRAKYLAASCIVNRARGKSYGEGLEAVIFAPHQFEVVSNGRIYRMEPTEETRRACEEALKNPARWVVGFSQGDLHSGWAEVCEVINGEYFYKTKK